MKNKALITIVALVLVTFGFNAEQIGEIFGQQGASSPANTRAANRPQVSPSVISGPARVKPSVIRADQKWSKTTPKVNLQHVFHGEINRHGKPVGFHSRPKGQDPAGARLVSVKSEPNRMGVYTATIEIRDGSQWKEKFSSFFPDNMDQHEVVDAILNAYKDSRDRDRQPWRGPSGRGFDIQGYTLSRGDINTAFPVYER
jgi:hypothetical protein